MTRSLEKLLGYMNQRFWEEEWSSRPVTFTVDIKQGPNEVLSFRQIFRVRVSGELASGTDCRYVLEMLGYLPVKVDIGEDRLSASGHRLLRELEDQHLGELAHFPLRQSP